MIALALAIAFTIGVSAFCSVCEAMILSTTAFEVDDLKQRRPKAGLRLEALRRNLDETISAILTLNTVANTLGAVIVGGLATKLFGEIWLGVVSGLMTIGILLFSEILPKNMGVAYRRVFQPLLAGPLLGVRALLRPLTWLCEAPVKWLLRHRRTQNASDREIVFLAEKATKEGFMSENECRMISSALSLDDVPVKDVMTPRSVVTALPENLTVAEVFKHFRTIPFGRIPVYVDSLDHATGIVRRRDILHELASGNRAAKLADIRQEPLYVPEVVNIGEALETLIKANQQLALVLDEFGGVAGVISLEDIVEHIIGSEIYEKDDMAVDMRQLALRRAAKLKRRAVENPGAGDPPPPTAE